MPYGSGTRLPGESASKLGHLDLIQSEWIRSLIETFETDPTASPDSHQPGWLKFDLETEAKPLSRIWAVDGSFVAVKSISKPTREVAFVKTAMLMIDNDRLTAIDKQQPHPLLLQEILADSATLHATVFPLKNISSLKANNYDSIRHIIYDSMKISEEGQYFETLKWLAYRKWDKTSQSASPSFECPHCAEEIKEGLSYNEDKESCPHCKKEVFLTDMIGFHLEMAEDSATDSVASSYMLIMEHIMVFSAVRVFWANKDKSLVSETLFIKDGPLTLRSQYSKLVPRIREFLDFAQTEGRTVHIIGQEKTGVFRDHLEMLVQLFPMARDSTEIRYYPLSHQYVRNEVYRAPDLKNPYGKRTNWGEKVYAVMNSGTYFVLNVPTGQYIDDEQRPMANDLHGIDRILKTIPALVSHKYESALFPIELANGIASLSNYPSAKILQRFMEDMG